MPLDRLVLIIVCVIAAAGATIWAVSLLIASTLINPALGLMALSLLALVGYIVWRVIAERINSPQEDHYDGIEK